VADFDHHCQWINNCIGGKNYALFIKFIISTFVTNLILNVLNVTKIYCECFVGDDLPVRRAGFWGNA
jgi:hypothetical protein